MNYEVGKPMKLRDLIGQLSQIIDEYGPEALDWKVMLEQESMIVGSLDLVFSGLDEKDKEYINRCEKHIAERRKGGWTIETGLGTLYDNVYEECAGGLSGDERKQMVFININY